MTDFKLADIQVGSALVENWGRPSAYFQRYLQANNRQVSAAIADLIAVQAELAQQQIEIQNALDLAQDAIDQVEDIQVTLTDIILGMGAGSFGLVTVSPNGSGDVSFPHGYANLSGLYPPMLGACSLQPTGGVYFHPQLLGVDAVNLTGRLFAATGAPLTTGSYVVAYRVAGL